MKHTFLATTLVCNFICLYETATRFRTMKVSAAAATNHDYGC